MEEPPDLGDAWDVGESSAKEKFAGSLGDGTLLLEYYKSDEEAARIEESPSRCGVKAGVPWTSFFSSSSWRNTDGMELKYIQPIDSEGRKVAACPIEAVRGERHRWKNALVGHFIGRRPSYPFTKEMLLKQWKVSGNVDINLLESGLFIFRFNSQEDRDKILEGGPWYVQRKPLVLRPWNPEITLGKIDLCSIPICVSLPNLPFQFWSSESLSAIGSVFGFPISTDRRTKTMERLSFARMCVEVNAQDDLPSTVYIKDESGRIFPQEIRYDWKPPRCNTCNVFGHLSEHCGGAAKSQRGGETSNHWNHKVDSQWQKKKGASEAVRNKNPAEVPVAGILGAIPSPVVSGDAHRLSCKFGR